MRSRTLVLVLVAVVMVITLATFSLGPTSAKAQGLVEYGTCLFMAQDTGAPVLDEELKSQLEATFGFTPWPDDFGVIGSCSPKFQGKMKLFTRLEFCLTVYKDEDESGSLNPFDSKQAELCETLKF